MKSKNTKTKISAGDVLIRTILILVVLIVAALLALLLYGVIAKDTESRRSSPLSVRAGNARRYTYRQSSRCFLRRLRSQRSNWGN